MSIMKIFRAYAGLFISLKGNGLGLQTS